MNDTTSLRYSRNTTALIRRSLGLTQQQLADYLNVLPQRVGDAEEGRRALTRKASRRQLYLEFLLPSAVFEAANAPVRTVQPPAVGIALPVPVPSGPLAEKERKEMAWRQETCAVEAATLRFDLAKRLARAQWEAHIQQMRQAVLAAFADPPLDAVRLQTISPDDDPQTTADLQTMLGVLFRRSARRSGLRAPAALARDQLRLYLLEAEAATLAAWLAADPAPAP